MAVDEKKNSQAVMADTRKAQALDGSKASDKKPDLRQVLSDSIGDFKRLSGILQKLHDFLPKHTEALNSAYKKVAEVVKTNNGVINGVKSTVTELQSEVSRLDAAIEKKLDSKLAQHEKKVGAEIEKLLAYRKSDRAVIWMLFIVCLISMSAYTYFNYQRRIENRALREKIDRLLERQVTTENSGEESSPKAKPEKKTPAKSKR